jgi:hypothetical protein
MRKNLLVMFQEITNIRQKHLDAYVEKAKARAAHAAE